MESIFAVERFFGGFDSRPTVYALTILSMVKIKFILLKCKQFRGLRCCILWMT